MFVAPEIAIPFAIIDMVTGASDKAFNAIDQEMGQGDIKNQQPSNTILILIKKRIQKINIIKNMNWWNYIAWGYYCYDRKLESSSFGTRMRALVALMLLLVFFIEDINYVLILLHIYKVNIIYFIDSIWKWAIVTIIMITSIHFTIINSDELEKKRINSTKQERRKALWLFVSLLIASFVVFMIFTIKFHNIH